MESKIERAYVKHSNGCYYVQVPTNTGFSLCSDDQSFPGGFGLGNGTWEIVEKNQVPLDELAILGDLEDYDF